MYAIIRAGGHQEKVTVGETITVDHVKQDPGTQVRYVPLLVSTDDGETITDHKRLEESASVTGNVVQHVKGEKLEVFQYRQKTGYRRHIGARQLMTLVEIAEIRVGDKVATLEEAKAALAEAKEAEAAIRAAKAEKKAEKKLAAKAEKKAEKPNAAAKPTRAKAATKKPGRPN